MQTHEAGNKNNQVQLWLAIVFTGSCVFFANG